MKLSSISDPLVSVPEKATTHPHQDAWWQRLAMGSSLLLLLPIVAIFAIAIFTVADHSFSSQAIDSESTSLFLHLWQTVLPTYTLNTLLLVLGTLLLSSLFALPSAWLMAMYQLPSGKVLQWALILPLAMPGYLVGYIYSQWFDYSGFIQQQLRAWTGWSYGEYWFIDFRTLSGAILILSLVLYPYIYLLARSAFMEQSQSLLQSARLLGCSAQRSFFKLSLPLARPAIAVGLSLVAMETLGDFGTVSYLGVGTLTTAVYDTWLGYSNLSAAAQIASLMLLLVILALSAERYSRRKQQFFERQQTQTDEDHRHRLSKGKQAFALLWCWGLVSIAFLLPLGQLLSFTWDYSLADFGLYQVELLQFSGNSFMIASVSAFLAVVVAIVVNFNHRLSQQGQHPPRIASHYWLRLSSLGYAVPGTILAIGILAVTVTLDHRLNDLLKLMQLSPVGLVLSGSMIALILAMVVRFSAVAVGSIESHLSKISPSLDMSARVMGYDSQWMLWRVHLPLIRRGMLVALLLVFIETMKELNAALLLRPFNFETLATYVYTYASDEQLEQAAIGGVFLVLVGLIPLIIMNRSLERSH